MARVANRLTARQVEAFAGPGILNDGAGLRLVVDKKLSKYWVFRYTKPGGGLRDFSLGSAAKGGVTLAEARQKRQRARDLLDQGIDPMAHKKEAAAPKAEIPTFGTYVVDTFLPRIKPGFRSDKSYDQWVMTLGVAYCKSLLNLRIDQITSSDILAVLQPVWIVRADTASKLRGRLERVFDAAKADGLRQGENPAIWRGGLKAALPAQSKLTRGHHEALPYPDLPAFITKLREREALAAPALEFLILTAARSGEVRGATWSEIDMKAKVWTVPAKRMKAGREHRVPLTPRAIEILEAAAARKHTATDLVFPGQKLTAMSDMTLAKLIKRMGAPTTVHGLRSTFRDWVGEATDFQREVAEAALAHTVGDATERAYRRGDALEKRRKLMEAWEKFCLGDTEMADVETDQPLRDAS